MITTAVLVALMALVAATPTVAVAAPRTSVPGGGAVARPLARVLDRGRLFPSPVPTSVCKLFGSSCYTPLQYRTAYDLAPLYQQGITGAGRTIVIVDSYGSPTIVNDLKTFDARFGLPPADLQIMQFGKIPSFNVLDSDMVGWAVETTLDVEYAHAMAPGAKIVLAETAVSETEGVTGLPEMMNAEKSLIDQGIGDVISQSFGATENTFPGFAQGDHSSLTNLRYAFTDAAAHSVTVLAGGSDDGATDFETDQDTLYPYRVTDWPASDPLVTSVGGTQLRLADNGQRLSPDTVWHDTHGAGGGGQSAVFARPSFQNNVAATTGPHRGVPDISMTAAVDGGAWVYLTLPGTGIPGWLIVGGTSEATPILSGVVALADQYAHRRLGDLNPALYTLGQASTHARSTTGIVDITAGNNTFAHVSGFTATTGYDLASGWGTIDGAEFVPALARVG